MIRTDDLIIVFTRNPELGKVKTRLASSIGPASALNIYNYLLKHTANIVSQIECDKNIYYSEKILEKDLWADVSIHKRIQKGIGLGERMRLAFQDALDQNYKKVLIVGSDLLDLRAEHLEEAFHALETNDVVLGPAKDGGYYLLGLKQMIPALFKNKNWGSSSVLKDTLSDLNEFTTCQLEPLNDIDTFEDMRDIPELIKLIEINE